MTRHVFRTLPLLCFCLSATLGLSGCTREEASEADTDTVDRSMELAKSALVVDTHIDVPYRLHEGWVDVSKATEGGDFDYPRAKAGGLDVIFMSIYVPADVDAKGEAKAFAEGLIDTVEAVAADSPDKFGLATCTADVGTLKAAGRIAMAMGMENGGPIAGDLKNVAYFADRGIRYVTLAHSKSNHISHCSLSS